MFRLFLIIFSLVISLPVKAQQFTPPKIGNWSLSAPRIDKESNRTNIVIHLSEKSQHNVNKGALLIIGCIAHKTNMKIIWWGNYLGQNHPGNVKIKLGQNVYKTAKWNITSDGLTSLLPNPIAFIKQMIPVKTLMIKTVSYDSSQITANFELDGLEKAIQPIRQACHW